MNIRAKFLGAAESVTGSKFLLEIDKYKLLIDCGLFQGMKELRLRNWNELPIEPASIDTVVLTHAHIDHSGYLPLLYKNGYAGKVHCTEPTRELLEILLTDSAKLQEEEAEFANKKGYSKHHPANALYTIKDTELVFPNIESHLLKTEFRLNENIIVSFFDAGHILGAASIEIKVTTSQGIKTLIFSGDLGMFENPLHMAPEKPKKADILFMESTYGGRNHHQIDLENELIKVLEECDQKGGCLVIPAFSLGRTQLILYYLWKVFQNMRSRPVYVDSPMAISVTWLYKKFEAYHRLKSIDDFGHSIFDAPFVHYITRQDQSRMLNSLKNNAVILSASGMATGGRVLHHLYHRLPNEQDTVLFTGFQAEGTRGRRLLEGEKEVKIFGELVPVKAKISVLEGLSAHADQEELLNWLDEIHDSPKRTFLIHGEKEGAETLKQLIEKKNWNVTVPKYLESFTLFDHI
ncbi:MAG: MBL fold metallo-hydrolase RNA specificity domain-containing protein [Bacteroidota bacterium]